MNFVCNWVDVYPIYKQEIKNYNGWQKEFKKVRAIK